MLFSYRIRRSYYLSTMLMSLFLMGIAYCGSSYFPFYAAFFRVIILYHCLMVSWCFWGMLVKRPKLWGDGHYLYYRRFIFWKKKLRWSELVSLRFEKENRPSDGLLSQKNKAPSAYDHQILRLSSAIK